MHFAGNVHNQPMHTLQIRDFPAPLYRQLSLRAQQSHRSLTQQAIAELEAALQPTTPIRRQLALQKLRVIQALPNTHRLGCLDIEQWQRTDRERC